MAWRNTMGSVDQQGYEDTAELYRKSDAKDPQYERLKAIENSGKDLFVDYNQNPGEQPTNRRSAITKQKQQNNQNTGAIEAFKEPDLNDELNSFGNYVDNDGTDYGQIGAVQPIFKEDDPEAAEKYAEIQRQKFIEQYSQPIVPIYRDQPNPSNFDEPENAGSLAAQQNPADAVQKESFAFMTDTSVAMPGQQQQNNQAQNDLLDFLSSPGVQPQSRGSVAGTTFQASSGQQNNDPFAMMNQMGTNQSQTPITNNSNDIFDMLSNPQSQIIAGQQSRQQSIAQPQQNSLDLFGMPVSQPQQTAQVQPQQQNNQAPLDDLFSALNINPQPNNNGASQNIPSQATFQSTPFSGMGNQMMQPQQQPTRQTEPIKAPDTDDPFAAMFGGGPTTLTKNPASQPIDQNAINSNQVLAGVGNLQRGPSGSSGSNEFNFNSYMTSNQQQQQQQQQQPVQQQPLTNNNMMMMMQQQQPQAFGQNQMQSNQSFNFGLSNGAPTNQMMPQQMQQNPSGQKLAPPSDDIWDLFDNIGGAPKQPDIFAMPINPMQQQQQMQQMQAQQQQQVPQKKPDQFTGFDPLA